MKITLNVRIEIAENNVIELTEDEARSIYSSLKEIFEKQKPTPITWPDTFPAYPWDIICTPNTENITATFETKI